MGANTGRDVRAEIASGSAHRQAPAGGSCIVQAAHLLACQRTIGYRAWSTTLVSGLSWLPWEDVCRLPYCDRRRCPSSIHIWEAGLESVCLPAYVRGGSICNENPFITPSTNALGFYAICQTKDQSAAVITVHETLFHLTKFNKLQAI